ncbi:hypothetical protein [Novosphingobium sp. M1R2S20]|uniref:Uncharacterized protein n=1 Tax=Novosphingobium rhizovicinum TaxID=3228928 RepID=A0ABV3RAZ9_9SPHN
MNQFEHAILKADEPAGDCWYGSSGSEPAGLPLTLSIYADRAHVRGILREDAQASDLRVSHAGDLAAVVEGEARPLADIVLVDCPIVDGQVLAALTRLDLRAARTGTRLIVPPQLMLWTMYSDVSIKVARKSG